MVKFYDTCSILEGYSNLGPEIMISTVTLEELEEIKTSRVKSDDIKFKARKALKNIEKTGVTVIHTRDALKWYEETEISLRDEKEVKGKYINDDLIIICAKYVDEEFENVVFYSEDLLCKMKARDIWNLEVSSLGEEERNYLYTGFKKIEGTADEINEFIEKHASDFVVNEYLVMHNTDEDKWSELRFNGQTFVGLKLPPSNAVKGKNSLQRCALDALFNKDITSVILMGTSGSGKTFLAMTLGKYFVVDKETYAKLVTIRDPKGEGTEIGFLPGDFVDKTEAFILPLADQLKRGIDELKRLMDWKLENTIPYFCKGRTFDDSYIIVDEAEDLTSHLIKMLGTRVGKDAKIVFSGDYKQSLIDSSVSNPLLETCELLKGNEKFACIMFDEDVRSETSKMFANADWGV